jgi:hypothetical protein
MWRPKLSLSTFQVGRQVVQLSFATPRIRTPDGVITSHTASRFAASGSAARTDHTGTHRSRPDPPLHEPDLTSGCIGQEGVQPTHNHSRPCRRPGGYSTDDAPPMHGPRVCFRIGQRGIWTCVIGQSMLASGSLSAAAVFLDHPAAILGLGPGCQPAVGSITQDPADKTTRLSSQTARRVRPKSPITTLKSSSSISFNELADPAPPTAAPDARRRARSETRHRDWMAGGGKARRER